MTRIQKSFDFRMVFISYYHAKMAHARVLAYECLDLRYPWACSVYDGNPFRFQAVFFLRRDAVRPNNDGSPINVVNRIDLGNALGGE